MKTLKKISFTLLVLLFTISCKKDDLPKATQEGKNMMAAKIDGKTWIKTACWSCIGAGSGLSASYGNNFFSTRGEQFINKDNNNSVIGIFLVGNKLDEYFANGGTNFIEFNDYAHNKFYITTKLSTGTITVTKLDFLKKIISGTFNGKVENKNDSNDIVSITDGRFDVTFN